jgi:virginiamycin B lyase
LSTAGEREFPLPGGDASFATGGVLDPHDVAVDGRGIVWSTLAHGNAIARLDPAHATPGASEGIRIYPLAGCPACAPPFPPAPGAAEPPSRMPDQMAVQEDGAGNTIVWFSELAADAIGVLRVAHDGSPLGQLDIPCACSGPKGIALGDDGSVWFTEETSNRLGRLTLEPGPFEAAAAQIVHYTIPSAPLVVRPGLPEIATSSPHSVAVDELGRVWFTEEENSALGHLDPALARPGSTSGIVEVPLPNNEFREQPSPADLTVDRSNKVFFADEYGDAIGSATAAGGFGQFWRPRARQSITDEPVVDASGNLWFTETAANLLTRLSGVATPALPPAPAPVFTADTTRHEVTATGLRDVSAVDVAIERNGAAVLHASAVVTAGAFTVDAPVRGGDVVTLTLTGPYPHAAISFRVVALPASVAHDGAVHGTMGPGGAPLGDAVLVGLDGRTAGALIARDGAFASPPGFASETASGTVTYAGATRAGTFRTVAGFGPAPVAAAPAKAAAPPTAPAAPVTKKLPAAHPAVTVAALGRRALALVSYPWRTLGYRLVFLPGRAGIRAKTDTAHRTITVYVRTTDAPQRIAHDIAHELGHAYDARFLRFRDRRAYVALRGRPHAAWWPTAAGSDYATGAGDFAEVFALCHSASREFRSTLAPRPAHPCALLGRLSAKRGKR